MWIGEPHPFSKENHLSDWARQDNQVKKGDLVERQTLYFFLETTYTYT
jgi:hypothetical protein